MKNPHSSLSQPFAFSVFELHKLCSVLKGCKKSLVQGPRHLLLGFDRLDIDGDPGVPPGWMGETRVPPLSKPSCGRSTTPLDFSPGQALKPSSFKTRGGFETFFATF